MKLLKALFSVNIFTIVADLLGAILLAIYALLIGPLGVLRGPLAMEKFCWYMWALLPQGLMARAVRTAIDWRIGNFDAAIAQLEGLVGSNEDYYKEKPTSRARRRTLEDLYTILARAYMHAGHIDDAMLVVIRAKKSMGIERLSGLAELDAKTAHLVRAGLAAGRLLDGGGLATMFVKSTPPKEDATAASPSKERQGATKHNVPPPPGSPSRKQPTTSDGDEVPAEGAKIIPFPRDEQWS